jgi:hypothetical protein
MYLYDLGKGVSRYALTTALKRFLHGTRIRQGATSLWEGTLLSRFFAQLSGSKETCQASREPAGISIRKSLEARRTENYHSRLTLDIIRYLINSLYNIISYNISIDTILSGDPSDPGDPAYIVDIYKPTSPQPTGAKPLGSGILPKMNSTISTNQINLT